MGNTELKVVWLSDSQDSPVQVPAIIVGDEDVGWVRGVDDESLVVPRSQGEVVPRRALAEGNGKR